MKKRTLSGILMGVICATLIVQPALAVTSEVLTEARGLIGAIYPGLDCACDGDMDNNGVIQVQDILFVIDCVNGVPPTPPMVCSVADVNCDGTVDLCDASRVYCQFGGMSDCCETTLCGACCSDGGAAFDDCTVTSDAFCVMFPTNGAFLGDGTVCAPYPCDGTECETHIDCDDDNVCTADVCTPEGVCVNNDLPVGSNCSDGIFCNGAETCDGGACEPGAPPSCDDGFACTTDECNAAADECVNTPAACDNDGVCDSPCETPVNCPNDCDECPCDGDVDGNFAIQLQDILLVLDCANGVAPTPPLTCDAADVNCDGTVDFCDAARVYCAFQGMSDCCESTVCGACCSDGTLGFDDCIVTSTAFCDFFPENGVYKGDGTVCDPWPCDTVECETPTDCDDDDVCTIDVCTPEGNCAYDNAPDGTACSDGIFCNGAETCDGGVCEPGAPPSCDDGFACTTDECNVAADECVNTPAACNDDGVCDSPCETALNCPNDCDECPCVIDQDGNGVIQIQDFLVVITCAEGGTPTPPLSCDLADLNCDGVIDYCDVSRVYCAFVGNPDCCDADIVCGACCNSGANFGPCLVISEDFCYSGLIHEGDYLGDGTTCDPWPCETTPCEIDEDCFDGNACTADTCTPGGICENTPLATGTPCSDDLFCNGDETCDEGVCEPGPPRSCDDLNPCTIDVCDEGADMCVFLPIECNHDGVCDAPCETAENCADDCSSCNAVRDLAIGSMAYCPEVPKTVRIVLNPPPGALTAAVEDAPPDGWTQISNISDAGEYDAENAKVKWGPLFAPFPAELTYEVVPPVDAEGLVCFDGAAAFDDGLGEPVCGDECIEDSCCPPHAADETQPPCAGCSDECTADPGDGRIELCEVIGYACAWKRGCNDDLTGVTGSAYIWMVGECYCWDEVGLAWTPVPCSEPVPPCCEGGKRGDAVGAATIDDAATVTLESSTSRTGKRLRAQVISVNIEPPVGTSASAVELQIPDGWDVRTMSDDGSWDRNHGKIKWGPLFGDLPRTVTASVNISMVRAISQGMSGTVSFDGERYPVTAK